MRPTSFRSRLSGLVLVLLLSLLPGSVMADLLLPPLGYLGITPWANGVSTPPITIRVKINELASRQDDWPIGWYDTWQLVPFDSPTSSYDYVSGVVMGELGTVSIDPAPPYDWFYDGWEWHDETVKALSIAVRSFGSYRAKLRDAGSGNKGIYGNTSDQVFRPFYKGMTDTLKQRYRNLINMYTGIYLAYSSTSPQRHKVSLIEAQHASGNAVPTLSFWQPPGQETNSYPYLPSVSNPHSPGGFAGPGMPQLPLQGWTYTGGGNVTFWQLLSHYYPHTTLMNTQPTWTVDYYYGNDDNGCTGNIVQTTTTKWINFDWDTYSLGILNDGRDPNSSIYSNGVCMHFTTTASFVTDWYTFFVVADDGFKLYIDDVVVFNKWEDQSPTMYTVNVPVTAGNHVIRLTYYENQGQAVARMSWRRWNGMLGRYYDNVMPYAGYEPPRDQIILERFDPTVRFAWDTSSPLDTQETPDSPYPKIAPDSFGAVWTSSVFIPYQIGCRTLNFSAVTDDGMYVKIGGTVLLNQWHDQAPTAYNFSTCLNPGTYELKVYYYESGGGATARLSWN